MFAVKKKQQQKKSGSDDRRAQSCYIKKENYAETIEKTDGQHIVGVCLFFYAALQMGLPLEWRMLL